MSGRDPDDRERLELILLQRVYGGFDLFVHHFLWHRLDDEYAHALVLHACLPTCSDLPVCVLARGHGRWALIPISGHQNGTRQCLHASALHGDMGRANGAYSSMLGLVFPIKRFASPVPRKRPIVGTLRPHTAYADLSLPVRQLTFLRQ